MTCPYEYITEERVKELLTWEKAFEVTERALESVSTGDAYQSIRTKVQVAPEFNFLFSMPGYLKDPKYGALISLAFAKYGGNRKLHPPLPVISTNLAYMDEHTGVTKAVISANEAMEWVTAAASVTATKHLHGPSSGKPNKILAVIGAGHQGRTHAVAFQRYFNFSEVRIWNRTASKAENLVRELNKGLNKAVFITLPSIEDCLRGADVIITATDAAQTLVKYQWVKKGAHINAIGVNPFATELDADTYRASKIYTDYKEGADEELKHISALGVKFEGQVGDVITCKIPVPTADDTTIFQSLGMAVQYCAIARLIYDLHKAKK